MSDLVKWVTQHDKILGLIGAGRSLLPPPNKGCPSFPPLESWAPRISTCAVLTVRDGSALSDLDNIAVRIADVAADLAVLGDRLRDELRSATFPQFIARLNIRNAEIHKAVDVIRVGDAERYRWLIWGRPAPDVQNHPDIRQLKIRRRVAVTHGQNASAEDLFVVVSRAVDVGDGEKMRDADPLPRGHLIALLFDLYGVRYGIHG